MSSELYPAERLGKVTEATHAAGLAALLLTPGPELRYVTGYDAPQLERLTCLAVLAHGNPFLVVPRLELPAALAAGVGRLGIEVIAWQETDDPYRLVATKLGVAVREAPRGAVVRGASATPAISTAVPAASTDGGAGERGKTGQAGKVGLADRMWALMVLRLRAAMPGLEQVLAGPVLESLRMRKSLAEVAALAEAGAAIDRVHDRVPGFLRPGRTERQVGADIAAAILAEGHARVDFTIVASGPNAASPHHELSGRVLSRGDIIVVDIGGTMPSGYCSDSTRTYAIGAPPAEFVTYYKVLQDAQESACAAVRPGITVEAVDAAARDVIAEAGYGEFFIHRTGHGIGLETHEAPYIVAGNTMPLEPGMTFSVEPGIYPGEHGARIEDIVVCTEHGAARLNKSTRDLIVVGE